MRDYTPEEVKYRLAVTNTAVGEMALTYIHELEQSNNLLQRENKQLKTDFKVLSCSVDDFDELQNKLEEEQRKNNGLSDDLAKAKEIMKELLDTLKNEYSDYTFALKSTHPVLVEAEEFLKDNGVKND